MRTTQRTMAKTNLMAIWNITHTTRWPVNKAYCRRGTAAILIQGGQSEWSIAVASGPGQDLFPHHHPIIIMLSELSHHLCRRHLRPAHSLNASGRLISCLYAARRIYFVGGKLFRVQGISRKLPGLFVFKQSWVSPYWADRISMQSEFILWIINRWPRAPSA